MALVSVERSAGPSSTLAVVVCECRANFTEKVMETSFSPIEARMFISHAFLCSALKKRRSSRQDVRK